jgi:hypothetical protein
MGPVEQGYCPGGDQDRRWVSSAGDGDWLLSSVVGFCGSAHFPTLTLEQHARLRRGAQFGILEIFLIRWRYVPRMRPVRPF